MLNLMADWPTQLMIFVDGFANWHPPRFILYTASLLSALAAIFISRAMAAPPMVSLPIGYVTLFALALFSNYAGQDVHFKGTSEIQKLVLFTTAAHGLGAVMLMSIFKAGEARRR